MKFFCRQRNAAGILTFMKRGTIKFTPTELSTLFQALSTQLKSKPLLNKLSPTQSTLDQTIQLSSEEAELILDNLPIPTEIEDQELLQAHKKIRDFVFGFNQDFT